MDIKTKQYIQKKQIIIINNGMQIKSVKIQLSEQKKEKEKTK